MRHLLCIIALCTFTASLSFAVEPATKRWPASNDMFNEVCKELHTGAPNEADLISHCTYEMQEFVNEQTYTKVAELAKKTISGNSNLKSKFTKVATAMIAKAAANKVLVTKGAKAPSFGLNDGIGGGIKCTFDLDYAADDYDPPTIPGQYACSLRAGVWIKYKNNKCSGSGFNKTSEELQIEFSIKENGSVIESTIKTRPLVVISSCAA